MSDVAIKVEDLGKRFMIGKREAYKTARETVTSVLGAPFRMLSRKKEDPETILWALKDVNFEIKRGEAVGIIGRNGAGKSTLLKVLSRITELTEGNITINGRVGCLLEVGTGFHPELTGRENIYMNGAILGMRRAEITRKFDEIVAFSEVDRFLDTPVKRYSSGMYTRLAFAVAAHLEPEILVVDEVLAVGDAEFQKKCLGKMGDVAKGGRTVLFVSHNMGAITSLCKSVVYLEQGRVHGIGPSRDLVSQYLERGNSVSREDIAARKDRQGDGSTRITALRVFDSHGRDVEQVVSGEDVAIKIRYRCERPGYRGVFTVSCFGNGGEKLFHVDNEQSGIQLPPMQREGEVTCILKRLPLPFGRYSLNAMIKINDVVADHVPNAGLLYCIPGDYFQCGRTPDAAGGLIFADHTWVGDSQNHQIEVKGVAHA